jgi:hypothetical protein
MADHISNYPSRAEQNTALVLRTAVTALLAWILVRATWPTEFLAMRLGDLTFGELFFGILWLLLSLFLAAILFAYVLRAPPRKQQFNLWCEFWIWTGGVVGSVYLVALWMLVSPRGHGIWGNIVFSISAFMWSLVI